MKSKVKRPTKSRLRRAVTTNDTVATLIKKARGNGEDLRVRTAVAMVAREWTTKGKRVRQLPETLLNAAEALIHAANGMIDERELLGLGAGDAMRIARVGIGFLGQGKDDAAHAAGQLAAWLDDKCGEAWFVWAAAAARLGREAEAIGAYQKTLALAPSHLPASVDLAELHIRRLQYAEAAKRLDFVLKADPKALTPAGKRAQVLVVNTLMQLEGA